jgi:hypothetical protein
MRKLVRLVDRVSAKSSGKYDANDNIFASSGLEDPDHHQSSSNGKRREPGYEKSRHYCCDSRIFHRYIWWLCMAFSIQPRIERNPWRSSFRQDWVLFVANFNHHDGRGKGGVRDCPAVFSICGWECVAVWNHCLFGLLDQLSQQDARSNLKPKTDLHSRFRSRQRLHRLLQGCLIFHIHALSRTIDLAH